MDNNINKINFGRKRIILNYDVVDESNFLEVFGKAKTIFESNKRDCEYLLGMYLGKQDILNRPAPNTSNINNTTVVNYAFPITREIVGYTFGNPFEFVASKTEYQADANTINDIFDYEGTYATDINAATYASVCGFSYEITVPSPDISKDNTPDIPIITSELSPVHTFVVQSTSIGNPQIMSCMEITDSNGNIIKYDCYTKDYEFTINTSDMEKFSVSKNAIGLDPIVMIENSLLLTGDWEQAIPIMNATNLLTSDSLNDIEGTIKSLLVILGTDLGDSTTTLSTIKDKRLLSLFSPTNSGSVDAKFISPQLDSAEVQEIRQFLNDARNVITGVPDRQTSGSTGDTGVAVINRNGWTDIEIVAKLKELLFKKAKKRQLNVVISILKDLQLVSDNLSAINISVNLGRDTLSGLSEKAQAFATLVATGELATIDALTFSGLTNRTNEVVKRGEDAKAKRQKDAMEVASQNAQTNSTDNSQSTTGEDTAK